MGSGSSYANLIAENLTINNITVQRDIVVKNDDRTIKNADLSNQLVYTAGQILDGFIVRTGIETSGEYKTIDKLPTAVDILADPRMLNKPNDASFTFRLACNEGIGLQTIWYSINYI